MDSLEELKTLIEEKKAPIEIFDAARVLIEAEKARGIKESGEKGRQAATLRPFKIALERLAKELGHDKIEDADVVASEILGKIKNGESKDSEVQKQLSAITKKLADADREKVELLNKNKQSTIKSKVLSEFERRLYSHGLHLDNVVQKGRLVLNDDETVVWKNGDEELDFKTGLEKYINENKDSAKNLQKPGANTSSGLPNKNNTNMITITQAELDAMSPKRRASVFADARKDGREVSVTE